MNVGYVFHELGNGAIAKHIVKDLRKRGFVSTCDFKRSRKGNGHFYLRVLASAAMCAGVSQSVYSVIRDCYGINYVHTCAARSDGSGACVIPFTFTIQK